jgi:Na+-driven multidrug efflux pump
MLLSVAIDIALNPVFIFGFGPIPRLGIAGSALASVVAQTVSLTALVVHLYRRRHVLCLHKNELSMLRVDSAIVGTLVRKGIPMSGDILVLSLSSVLMITLVNRFGVDTTAAFGASIQLWNYVLMPAVAVAVAVSTMVSQNVGAQKWDRVKSIARVGVVYSMLSTGCIVLVIEILDTHAFELFVPTGSQALLIASHINRVVTWSWVFLGVSMVLLGIARATGAVMAPLLIATLSLLVLRFPLAEMLLNRWQADAIWWSFPISSALDVVLAGLYYKYGGWRTTRLGIPASVEGLGTHSTEG